jgi:hypothetical protein
MSKLPKVPVEQRSFKSRDAGGKTMQDQRDDVTGLQSGQPGDADANLDQQGRFGNLHQNMTTQHKSGDR